MYEAGGADPVPALHMAADDVVPAQLAATSLPKRFSIPMREIWVMQPRLKNTRGARGKRLLSNPRFRAAYDFLCLRRDTGEDLQKLCSTWESIQQTPEAQAILEEVRSRAAARRRPKMSGKRNGARAGGSPDAAGGKRSAGNGARRARRGNSRKPAE